jgi:hypothetical protein
MKTWVKNFRKQRLRFQTNCAGTGTGLALIVAGSLSLSLSLSLLQQEVRTYTFSPASCVGLKLGSNYV